MLMIQMAWRNIWRSPVRSAVIITSVALGILAGVFIMGLYDGIMRSRLNTLIHTEVGHLQLHHPEFKNDYDAAFTIKDPQKIISTIQQEWAIESIASRSIAQGMLATSTGSAGVQVNGVMPIAENNVSQLSSKVIEGDGFESGKRNPLIISRKLADKMKINLGAKVVLTFTDRDNTIVSGAFRVTGIYRTENTPLDERNVYLHADDLNRLLGMEDECHEIAIVLQSDDDMETIAALVKARFPELLVETWKDLSPESKLMIETTDTYSIIFICIIMLALMFGIINTMLMAVLERTREIGMLVALGMNKVKLFMLVLWETILLTLAGAPFGFVLAWLIIGRLSHVGIDISSFAGEAMSGFGFSSMIYPEFPWFKLHWVLYIVCTTALLASLFPSYKALRLVPVEAMRQ